MRDADRRCQEYFHDRYVHYLRALPPGKALNECLHDFLDQRPSGKFTTRNRALGLIAAEFWLVPAAVAEADLASLALARVLQFGVLPRVLPHFHGRFEKG